MTQTDAERAKDVARNLVELLTAYEEELMGLERDTPAVGPLRRAVGMAIAEACYWISDESADQAARWTPRASGRMD